MATTRQRQDYLNYVRKLENERKNNTNRLRRLYT